VPTDVLFSPRLSLVSTKPARKPTGSDEVAAPRSANSQNFARADRSTPRVFGMRLLRRALARVADAAARATAVETRAESIASGPGLRSGRQHRTATSSALGVEPIAWAGSARSTFSSAMKATRRIPSGTPGASYASSGAAASAVSARRLGGFAVAGVRSEGTARGLPGQERASAWAMAHTRGYAKEAVKTMKVRRRASSISRPTRAIASRRLESFLGLDHHLFVARRAFAERAPTALARVLRLPPPSSARAFLC